MRLFFLIFIPAKAGLSTAKLVIQRLAFAHSSDWSASHWTPAFAGMTI